MLISKQNIVCSLRKTYTSNMTTRFVTNAEADIPNSLKINSLQN